MIKAFHKIICIFLLSLLLTGCWDYRDIDRKSIVLSIGVDEVNDKAEYSGEMAKPSAGGGKAKITQTYKYVSLGKSFEDARNNLNAKITEPDFPGAIRSVVFSKKYAETVGIEGYINRLYYIPEFRNSILVAICKEPTKEFFNGKVENSTSIGYAAEDTIRTLSENGGTLYTKLQSVKADIEFGNIGYMLTYVTKKDNAVEYLGLAAIKDSKLIGIVEREDSIGFLYVLSKKPVVIMPLPHPSYKEILISTKTSLKQRKISTEYKENKINININLKLNAQIQYLYEYKPIGKEDISKLENMISEKIKKDIISALELSKTQYKCDVFGFARYFQADNPEKYKQINWKEEYPNANFNVNVKTIIRNTSLLDVYRKQ